MQLDAIDGHLLVGTDSSIGGKRQIILDYSATNCMIFALKEALGCAQNNFNSS